MVGRMDHAAKVNYQTELDSITRALEQQGRSPSLLLHSCCGPCSSYVVTYLRQWFDITVLYFNPNIYPKEEYEHRLREQERLLEELGIPLIRGSYDHQDFLQAVRGLETEPEGGARCEQCFRLRLRKTMELAQREGFAYFATTLTVSPHKNAMVINRVGQELAAGNCLSLREEEPGKENPGSAAVLWLPSDFKKKDGYQQSIALSRQYGLYRQAYCGCEFAMEHLKNG